MYIIYILFTLDDYIQALFSTKSTLARSHCETQLSSIEISINHDKSYEECSYHMCIYLYMHSNNNYF